MACGISRGPGGVLTAGLRLCRACAGACPGVPGGVPARPSSQSCVVGEGEMCGGSWSKQSTIHCCRLGVGWRIELDWIGGGGVKEEKQAMHLSPPALTILRRATVERARRKP